MRKINREQLIDKVAKACIEANLKLECDVEAKLKELQTNESHERGKSILNQIDQNMKISRERMIPLCQDTGIVVMFIKLGNQIQLDFDLYEALNEAIIRGYEAGNLRKSVVEDPLKRINTKTNAPGVYHVELTNDDTFEITIAPKGAGSENMSALKMFNPQTPKNEIEDYIIDVVCNAKGKPCPPIVVGVGIGGTFEKAAIMAKKAVLEPIGKFNYDEYYVEMEAELIKRINETGIGPMGLGGDGTCMDVSINQYPAHIASLAVAINIQCHVSRHKVVKL